MICVVILKSELEDTIELMKGAFGGYSGGFSDGIMGIARRSLVFGY
jgi:hypothetical protein